jgi:anti-sigma regulatory factor (Ser/Thr protein kinase)
MGLKDKLRNAAKHAQLLCCDDHIITIELTHYGLYIRVQAWRNGLTHGVTWEEIESGRPDGMLEHTINRLAEQIKRAEQEPAHG